METTNITPASNTGKPDEKIKVTTQFNKTIYMRILKARKSMGMTYDQDIVRIAVSAFLDKAGY